MDSSSAATEAADDSFSLRRRYGEVCRAIMIAGWETDLALYATTLLEEVALTSVSGCATELNNASF